MSAETLTKARLAERIHDSVGLSKKESAEIIDEVFDLMRGALLSEEKLKITGFGNWIVRDKAARRGRNPQTNDSIIIARRRVLSFKPSPVLRVALNAKE